LKKNGEIPPGKRKKTATLAHIYWDFFLREGSKNCFKKIADREKKDKICEVANNSPANRRHKTSSSQQKRFIRWNRGHPRIAQKGKGKKKKKRQKRLGGVRRVWKRGKESPAGVAQF